MRWFTAAVLAVGAIGCSTDYSTIADATDAAAASPDASVTCTDSCPTNACGLVRLACGPTDCGTCSGAFQKCVDGACKCVPQTCTDVKAQCGTVPDGCGGQIFCGTCASPGDGGALDGGAALACGAEYVCTPGACVPKIPSVACFSPNVRLCGKQPDGCGGVVDCGTSACSGTGESCGGGGQAGVCGCKPLPSCSGPCFSRCADGCGGMRNCSCSNCH